ncbi:MAG: hypothetical protein M3Q75_10085 [Gemmatimonadota bacterium]|nr:hypothetical protein [Gemmatimonadota bacterium]
MKVCGCSNHDACPDPREIVVTDWVNPSGFTIYACAKCKGSGVRVRWFYMIVVRLPLLQCRACKGLGVTVEPFGDA